MSIINHNKSDFLAVDFRASNYISLINRELEFYFNHHTKSTNSLDISRMEGLYIILLKDNPSITQLEISNILKTDITLVAKFTKILINKGYITKVTYEFDRRKKLLNLTEKAQKILPELLKIHEDFNKIAFGNLRKKQYDDFLVFLEKIFDNIQVFKNKK